MSEPALQEDGDHVEEAPLSEAEERFLVDIRGQVRQLFVVVNKMDMLGETERKEVLGYIHSRVEQIVGIGAAQLSPLSARDGLTTKLNHDDVGIHRSGLTAFEQALTAFLAEAQGRTFLVSVMDRALHLFAQADPALAMATSDCEIEPPGSAFELRRTMESLRASLLAGTPLSAAHHAQELAVADPRVIEQAIAASRSPVHEAGDGQAQARARTCPICAAQAQALFAFFAKWQYRLATDTMAQRAFAAERGLCPVHTWQFQEMASPQGISDGYAPLIETLAVELSRLSEQSVERVAAPLAALLASTATCAACRLVLVTAAEQVEQLLAHLVTAQDREEYASSAGLCLPHLQAVLARVEDCVDGTIERSVVAEFLLREQVRQLEDLGHDLRSYTLKRDALRRGFLHKEEEYAWRRALVQLVGERAARGGAMMADQATV